ncbi:MAG: PEGA domain-containing protein [Candidatus Omnitrophota bacterium]|nr:PEGA domain-containing protein [Candidatus Omnitrophota bacterium]
MSNEQRIRGALFYLSVAVFLTGLPLILSFALGYKFNPRTFKFTKTGIISLKTQPQGADVYLDGKLLNDKTPVTINELLPGPYSLKIELKRHYPWVAQVNVEPRKVARFERIILFPDRPNIKQLNQDKVSSFWVDKEGGRVYYFNQEENILYKSNLEGEKFEEIGSIPQGFSSLPKELKISHDRQQMLIFSAHQICALTLKGQGDLAYLKAPVILKFPNKQVNNVFWHSDSYHLILVTDKDVEVLESDENSKPVILVSLNSKNPGIFYDTDKDALYFMDSQRGEDGILYNNTYKLELSNKENLLDDLIKLRQNAQD